MVTSKERTGSKSGAIALLFSAAVMLFTLMFGGVAAADDQAATTANAGAAGANTGGNGAAGNGSGNGANSNQKATSTSGNDDAVAPNSATSGNSSNGSASITTGDANATGNSATNNTQQTVVQGHNGAVVISDQSASTVNVGGAFANTGGNVAVGNGSNNSATANQGATSVGANGDSVATNDATVRNDSNGDARITTGDATATGSTSNNTINQSNTIDCSTCLGVVVLSDQNASITNVGLAVANTGGNVAVGNASTNNALANQGSVSTSSGGGDSVAANTGTASNNSNGSAGIITGDATAVGNIATNSVTQVTNVNAPNARGVIVLSDQNANVTNVGIGIANTGLNTAVGNLSVSTSRAIQGAVSGAGPPADDNVASNDAIVSNDSNGSANINTGNANAAGNRSTTNLTQAINVNTTGRALVLSDQNASVVNFGLAAANTGLNAGVGNASVNRAHSPQTAFSKNNGALGGDNVAANFGTAANTSNGSASIRTGNAAAAGNDSTTNVSQTVNANMNGGLVLPDQNALVVNAGIGIANTGLNLALGNVSRSTATTNQRALAINNADDSVASNFGDASTLSNGSASINTGNADSIGNHSAASTNIAQTVNTNGADMVVSDQTANVADFGIGVSNTGLNLAIGNASRTETVTRQNARVVPARGDAVASNFGDANIDSDGSASITTGNANAVGSSARTNISQTVDANGAKGFLLSDQSAASTNVGIAVANTGLNLAVGNAALFSVAIVVQWAAVLNGNIDDSVAANFGTAKVKSNGSASIHTGNAAAVGTRSHTNIAQTSKLSGTGFALVDQTATAASIGLALANTGGNIALGNVSESFAATRQTARLPHAAFPNADDLVASNDGVASIDSNGSAEIWTGSANAVGNESGSTTNISQTSDVNGAGFALVDQSASVLNVGVAVANSGLNLAVGNLSQNQVASVQDAAILEQGAGNINADDLVASNNATASNNSNGSAKIVTGPASAVGNAATTNVSQTSDFNGNRFTLVDQSASVVNVGLAAANSGLNVAVGNASQNNARSSQVARIRETGAGGINAEDVVAANNADTSNNSNGSASIITGAASATGSTSSTNVNQTADTNISGSGFSLNDQVAGVVNIGAGIANSGGNAAVGNASTNTARPNQNAQVRETGAGSLNADDVVAVNTSTTSNDSNGSASITTGSADATGNKASSNVNQTADTNISGNGFVLNDQAANVVNVGVSAANSGLNIAIGNASVNNARTVVAQNASVTEVGAGSLNAEDVVASNTSENGNISDGSASITTGAALANGNESASAINQVSDTNIAGTGFALVDQEMTVANIGASISNSGLNLAAGNVSRNNVVTRQAARIEESGDGSLNTEDAVAANSATAWNQSNGSASITTGNAHGTGNRSATSVNQTADNDITKGFELVDQGGLVVNAGLAVSNSGLNLALGNASQNTNNNTQTARVREAGAGNLNVDGDLVAANTQDLANKSDGSARIETGCSCAEGNISTTDLTSNGDGDLVVFNLGVGVSNSGLNIAIGNASTNAVNSQSTARFSENGAGNLNANDDVVAANTVTSNNWSRGSATIKTGNATGLGNTSTTSGGAGGDALVVNFGIGLSNTGVNIGVGNASTNNINSSVTAGVFENGAGNLNLGDDGVASNVITEVNDSNGTVDIDTGDAYALGNRSATGIVDAEDATTINFGLAFANSGLNIGAGNTSNNVVNHVAVSTAPGGVSSNVADLSNTSDGSANIRTGDAIAFGNIASNATCQGVDFGPLCPQPPLPPLPPINCRCDQEVPPPVKPPVDVPPIGPVPPVRPAPPVLARTGASVEGLALFGLLLLTIGVFLRRKARTA